MRLLQLHAVVPMVGPPDFATVLEQGDALCVQDARDVLAHLPSDAVDAVVTDPPYGETSKLTARHSRFRSRRQQGRGFAGKTWDETPPDPHIWWELLRVLKPGAYLVAFGGRSGYHRLATAIEAAGFVICDMLDWVFAQGMPVVLDVAREIAKMDPAGADAWRGFGIGLKPAHEAIVLAQKPLSEDTIAKNVLRWRVGALNIEACRGSRYPSDVVATDCEVLGPYGHLLAIGDSTIAVARKPAPIERNVSRDVDNSHPTVKPVAVVRWLVRLVTPPGGIVLDPFAGSGTTALAALAEGRRWVLVEREPEYADIAAARIEAALGLGLVEGGNHAA
jgi:site-specific DNA-methyltransferase (adenine-specific)